MLLSFAAPRLSAMDGLVTGSELDCAKVLASFGAAVIAEGLPERFPQP